MNKGLKVESLVLAKKKNWTGRNLNKKNPKNWNKRRPAYPSLVLKLASQQRISSYPFVYHIRRARTHFLLRWYTIVSYWEAGKFWNLFKKFVLYWLKREKKFVWICSVVASLNGIKTNTYVREQVCWRKMSCLLPQFKCLPDSFALTSKSHRHFATQLCKYLNLFLLSACHFLFLNILFWVLLFFFFFQLPNLYSLLRRQSECLLNFATGVVNSNWNGS